jgi:putative ABC transport system substrate-binding protein
MASVGDAVGIGLVTSLARPGGNVTGLSFLGPEVRGKQLELSKEMFPKVSRVVVFHDPAFSSVPVALREMEMASRSLGLQISVIEVRNRDEFDSTFKAAAERRAGVSLEGVC